MHKGKRRVFKTDHQAAPAIRHINQGLNCVRLTEEIDAVEEEMQLSKLMKSESHTCST